MKLSLQIGNNKAKYEVTFTLLMGLVYIILLGQDCKAGI